MRVINDEMLRSFVCVQATGVFYDDCYAFAKPKIYM